MSSIFYRAAWRLLTVWMLATGLPAAVRAEASALTLADCIVRGLERNTELQRWQLDLASAAAEVQRVGGRYDRRLALDAIWQDSEVPPGSFPSQGGVERGQFTGSLVQPLSSGTELGVEFDMQRNRFEGVGLDSDATWQTVAGLTVRQVLGRNAFGAADRADLAAARLREEVLRAGYERAEQEVAARIEQHFWRAAVAVVVADTQTSVVYRLGRLLEENRRRVEEGLLDETAVLAVEAALAVAEVEAERLRDEAIVRDEELKDLIDLPPGQWDWVRIAYRLPEGMPDGGGTAPGYAEVLASALASRADVEALRREAGRAEQVIRARTEDDRGEFAVSASLGRGDADTDWDETFDFDRTVWSVGAMAQLSLGRSASRASLTQALLARESVRLDQEALERRIALEVRTAVRQRETARRLVIATERALTAQRRKVARELERFRQGRSEISILLDAETDRDLAERDAAQARGDWARAEVAWRLAQGLPTAGGGAR